MGMSWKEISAVVNEWRQEQALNKILSMSEDDENFTKANENFTLEKQGGKDDA